MENKDRIQEKETDLDGNDAALREGGNVWRRMGIGKYVSMAVVAFLVLAAAILFAFLLTNSAKIVQYLVSLLRAAMPVLYGVVIAYILKPVYNRFKVVVEKMLTKAMKKHPEKADGISRVISSIVIVFMLLLVCVAVFAVLIPELYNSFVTLMDNLPTYIKGGHQWIESTFSGSPSIRENLLGFYDDITHKTSDYIANLFPEGSTLLGVVTSGIGSVMGFVYNIFIGMVVAIYILIEKDDLSAGFRRIGYAFFKDNQIGWLRGELRYADKMFSGYVFARFIDSILLGVSYALLGMIFRIPYVGMISVVIGVTNMIPFFGPYIGALPCFIILLLFSPIDAIKFIIIDMMLMQFDANVVSPKLIGNTTGLSSFWVLFAILFFGGLWGFVGMLIGVPLFAVIYHLISSLLDRRLKKKAMPTGTEFYIRDPVITKQARLRDRLKKTEVRKNDRNKKDHKENR